MRWLTRKLILCKYEQKEIHSSFGGSSGAGYNNPAEECVVESY